VNKIHGEYASQQKQPDSARSSTCEGLGQGLQFYARHTRDQIEEVAMTREDILAAKDMCDILGIRMGTLYSKRWRRASGIPVFRQGKYLFAYRREFDVWYERRAVA